LNFLGLAHLKGLGGFVPDCRPRHIVKAAKEERKAMSVIKGKPDASPGEIACILSASDTYIETLTLKQIAAQPWMIELVIKTQLLTAKRPEEKRVKARCCIERERVIELRDAVDRFLIKTGASVAPAKDHHARLNPHGEAHHMT
jgi:hypothetical protein